MRTIKSFLEEGALRAGSFNKLAGALGTSSANLTRLTLGAGHAGEETILRLAEYLGRDPVELLLINQAEKSADRARPYWKKLLTQLTKGAAIVILTIGIYTIIPENAIASIAGDIIHYQTLILLAILLVITRRSPVRLNIY